MTSSTSESTAGGHDDKQREQAFFFYLARRINSAHENATGLQIKQMIQAVVPEFDLSHTLVLEGHGHEQDRVINDGDHLSLKVGHGTAAKHFFSKPPTNFGHA
jgi:hypothetical protein